MESSEKVTFTWHRPFKAVRESRASITDLLPAFSVFFLLLLKPWYLSVIVKMIFRLFVSFSKSQIFLNQCTATTNVTISHVISNPQTHVNRNSLKELQAVRATWRRRASFMFTDPRWQGQTSGSRKKLPQSLNCMRKPKGCWADAGEPTEQAACPPAVHQQEADRRTNGLLLFTAEAVGRPFVELCCCGSGLIENARIKPERLGHNKNGLHRQQQVLIPPLCRCSDQMQIFFSLWRAGSNLKSIPLCVYH